ncbi:hypothetical protein CVIRNUC_006340 [Coccomyxa viridis]|uniref:Glycolipid transfer protein domain-containing protein n=1 Tax=Coccomyxa viridis TaxID=1274662 RepID=A0AAV1I7V0_9CHLO|nr:hypothetical protein CVIRNUC_006340 [Coccomyxa viridis]
MAGSDETFLQKLTRAFATLEAQSSVSTRDFTDAIETMFPVFDHLGTVFHFAKGEMNTKKDSLQKVQHQLPTLDAVVAADKKSNTVTKKNSGSRNLHRLLTAVLFVSGLLQNMAKNSATTLRQAASEAYDATLAPVHTYFVRTAVKASLYLLPDRATFLHSIGETEETAKVRAAGFVPKVGTFVERVMHLYDGTSMPASDVRFLPSAS